MLIRMISITFSKKFKKAYAKLHRDIREKFDERLYIFSRDRNAFILKRHKLKGLLLDCESVNITGDYRAIFEWVTNDHVEFLNIGTHSQLYEN
jgi:addiction module RelE/StbE family toxin